jgi:hypothetical protein
VGHLAETLKARSAELVDFHNQVRATLRNILTHKRGPGFGAGGRLCAQLCVITFARGGRLFAQEKSETPLLRKPNRSTHTLQSELRLSTVAKKRSQC